MRERQSVFAWGSEVGVGCRERESFYDGYDHLDHGDDFIQSLLNFTLKKFLKSIYNSTKTPGELTVRLGSEEVTWFRYAC